MKVPTPHKLPSGSWFIQLRLNGVSIPVTASTEKECRTQAALIKAEHAAGKRQITQTPGNIALTQAIDKYIAARSNILSPSTIRGYKIIQRTRFQSVMKTPLKNIKSWQSIINTESQLCNPKTLKNAWGFIRSVLKENGIAAPSVSLPQDVPNERQWLDHEQIKVFLKAIKGTDIEVPALLALHSLRSSEIFAVLKNNTIDLKKGVISVRGAIVPDENHKFVYKATNKNNKSRRDIPIMIPQLEKALITFDASKLMSQNWFYKSVNKVCEQNGLPKVGIHGLRHSFASLAHHLKIPEEDCMRLGGWSDYKTMHKIYLHLSEADSLKYENAIRKFYADDSE